MTTPQDSPLSRVIKIGDMEWEDLRPGIRAKNLWSDEATKRRAIMTRIEPEPRSPCTATMAMS